MTLLRYQHPANDVDEFPGFRLFQDSLTRFLNEPGTRPWTPSSM
ncbi:MAG: hypothetical protein ACRD7E_17815 [Bryobacteraceae bacterium]